VDGAGAAALEADRAPPEDPGAARDEAARPRRRPAAPSRGVGSGEGRGRQHGLRRGRRTSRKRRSTSCTAPIRLRGAWAASRRRCWGSSGRRGSPIRWRAT
jgi:hypothetical protein